MVLYLVLITFAVFVIFWLGDLVITLQTVKKLGTSVEANPLMRSFLKVRGKYIYLFKVVEVAAFLWLLIWYSNAFKDYGSPGPTGLPFFILLGYIFIYSMVVLNNSIIYFKAIKKQSRVFNMIYFLLILSLLAFMYLNYSLYKDVGVFRNELDKCQTERISSQIPTSCVEERTPNPAEGLNLSIRRGYS